MKAIIDADIIPYEYGSMKDLESGDLLPWEIVRHMVDVRIQQILEATKADEQVFYLTDSPNNFRLNTATILPYKGHRPVEKPEYYKLIQQHLTDNYDAVLVSGWEADDQCGIDQWVCCCTCDEYGLSNPKDYNTVICTRDKDLNMIPGWHYQWSCGNQQERLWFQNETSAIRCFYKQLLTGDPTDNIVGLFGVGNKSQLVKKIDEIETEQDMFLHCLTEYRRRFGNYAEQFMLENGTLLWILRTPNVDEFPERFDNLLLEIK